MNVEVDRLSNLPDHLIHKILSFISIKHAIEISILSSKWRFFWTSMPYLYFSTDDFSTLTNFSRFVTRVLSCLNNQIKVASIKLRLCGDFREEYVTQIIKYTLSQNIPQLDVVFLLENSFEFPLSLFGSNSLKHLSLSKESSFLYFLKTTSTLNLPALTTLYLSSVTLCYDDNADKSTHCLFSKCANLKYLTLKRCKINGSKILEIRHPQLSDLILENNHWSCVFIFVDTPQLENLTIKNSSRVDYLISAPELAFLQYSGYHALALATEDNFLSLVKVDLCVSSQGYADAHAIVNLFLKFQSVKFLTLNLEIVELLSSNVELISDHPSPFTNLEMLKIYPERLGFEEQSQMKVNINEVKSYLLDSSPNATFTMVSREEIRAVRNTKLAQNLMTNLRVLLEHEKAKLGERMTHINRCWIDLSEQIARGKSKTSDIISQLRDIKKLLTNVPASKRAELETCYSSLYAEADTVMNKITDHMKIQYDMQTTHFKVIKQFTCDHEACALEVMKLRFQLLSSTSQ